MGNFPTRKGPWIGRGNERQMMSESDVPGIRKRYRTNPDGSTTMLKTRAGWPHFITTEVKKDDADAKKPTIFQCVAVTVGGAKALGDGTFIHAFVRTVVGWGEWVRGFVSDVLGAIPGWTFVPDERAKWVFLESRQEDVSLRKNRLHRTVFHKGTLDWFDQTGEEERVVTWGFALGGRNVSLDGRTAPAANQHPIYRPPLFCDHSFMHRGVFINGEYVDGSAFSDSYGRVQCAALHNGKLRIIRGMSMYTYVPNHPTTQHQATFSLSAFEQDEHAVSPVAGWRLVASTGSLRWYKHHQLSFNPSGDRIVGIISDYDAEATPKVVEFDFDTLTPTFSHEMVTLGVTNNYDAQEPTYADIPGGAVNQWTSEPLSGYLTEADSRRGTGAEAFLQSYSETKYPVSVEYDPLGNLVVLYAETVARTLGHNAGTIRELVSKGWVTLSLAAAYQENEATLSALVWYDEYTGAERRLSPDNIRGIIAEMFINSPFGSGYGTSILTAEGTFEIPVVYNDLKSARSHLGYEGREILPLVDEAFCFGYKKDDEFYATSGTRVYRPAQIRTFSDPSYGLSIVDKQVLISGPLPVDGGQYVTLKALEMPLIEPYVSEGSLDPTVTTSSVSNLPLAQCDMRHGVYVAANFTGDPDFYFGELPSGAEAPEWWLTSGAEPAQQVTFTNTGAPIQQGFLGQLGWMTVDQTGQHVVVKRDPKLEGNEGLIYATRDGQTTVEPDQENAVFVSPIYFRKKP